MTFLMLFQTHIVSLKNVGHITKEDKAEQFRFEINGPIINAFKYTGIHGDKPKV